MPISEQVRGVIARILQISVSDVSPTAARGELANWDSLRHLDLVMELEAEFGCSFTMEEMTGMTDVLRITEVVSARRCAA